MELPAGADAGFIAWLRQGLGVLTWPLRDGRWSRNWGFKPRIRFQKYRVAPRLGADKVRRRILLGLREETTRILSGTSMA